MRLLLYNLDLLMLSLRQSIYLKIKLKRLCCYEGFNFLKDEDSMSRKYLTWL